ncbi:MAG TPA: FGGY family carbohydrate kinase [Chitinophagaceae bacterium]|nr:FGGY family carbohydrate kinase [Chitinophagaceae bacterium]
MLLLGIDIGTSSVKVSVMDSQSGKLLASAHHPETEADIIAPRSGWAEQSPDLWWEHAKQAVLKCHGTKAYDPLSIAAIGIAYQMHGLVLVDKEQHVLRNSIIWCDSRAVDIGNNAYQRIGEQECLSRLLNSPGNFTASKLAWVKENEPAIYEKIDKVMLPGDFIAMKLTGEVTTTIEALSEGIFWDFKENNISQDVTKYFGFHSSLFPSIQPLFAPHGYLKESVGSRLNLKKGIPVAYKSGDQPNNALALNVLEPGQVAATAGTSGVIYAVSDQLTYDPQSRVNTFAHVNYLPDKVRTGILLCINGAGIFNRWIKQLAGSHLSYANMNEAAAAVEAGCEGLFALPFGNGAERMLNNRMVGAHFHQLDLNKHGAAHLFRAVQEGIAFSFRYGLDIMRENGLSPGIVRAGKANLFLSDVFTHAFVNASGLAVEFYEGDGSLGAAIGAGIGSGIYKHAQEAFQKRVAQQLIEPDDEARYDELYAKWKAVLQQQLADEPIGLMT